MEIALDKMLRYNDTYEIISILKDYNIEYPLNNIHKKESEVENNE